MLRKLIAKYPDYASALEAKNKQEGVWHNLQIRRMAHGFNLVERVEGKVTQPETNKNKRKKIRRKKNVFVRRNT